MNRARKHLFRRRRSGPGSASGPAMGERICDVETESHNDNYVKCRKNADLNNSADSCARHASAEASGHDLNQAYQTSTDTHFNTEVAHVAKTPSDHSTLESESKTAQQKPEAQVVGAPLATGAPQVAKAITLSTTAETGSGIGILLKPVHVIKDRIRPSWQRGLRCGAARSMLRFACTAGLGLCLMLPFSAEPGQASPAITRLDPRTAGMLDFIGSLEAPGGYDVYSHYAAAPPPKPLTKMTVNEVLAWQDRIDARSRSEAAGRFQIMEDTLRDYLVPTMGLTGQEKFNADMQNAMAVVLMQRRGWSPKGTNHVRMGNALAKEWAALPLLSGPNIGKSAHHKTKGARNRALTTPEQFLAVLQDPTKAKAVLNAVSHTPAESPVKITKLGLGAVRIRTFQRTRPTAPDDLSGGALKPSRVIVFDVDPYAQN